MHFRLLDPSHLSYHEKKIIMPVHQIRHVKSSNGTIEERIFIKTTLELYGRRYRTELSLTDRKSMKYPMLIGRKFLEGRFVVDVALTYQSLKNQKA